MHFDVIIIGAGAAGLMCALTAGQRGKRVLLLDHAAKVGKKILISGGGRCNFTNLWVTPENYLSQNPHFCKSALSRYTQYDFIDLVEKHDIPYHEKTLGQLFCDGSSKQIVALLLKACRQAHVQIQTGCKIHRIRKSNSFQLDTSQGVFQTASVVIATGGLSIPKMGATSFGYDIAKQFGLNIIDCRPGLVPLTWPGDLRQKLGQLAGISAKAEVSCEGQSFQEAVLFTHRGLSGPAILQISSYWRPGQQVSINLLPKLDIADLLQSSQQEAPSSSARSLLKDHLPKRLRYYFLPEPQGTKPLKQLTRSQFKQLSSNIQQWHVLPAGSEGYRKAEVTCGGVDTNELSSKTFEAKKVPGLYFIGEVVDVTGWLGGYNFQWAWSSGYCAGLYV
ncbi:MAG: NAD(P)/FAD-dependent oxidoreductase [Chloroflexota bacterium]